MDTSSDIPGSTGPVQIATVDILPNPTIYVNNLNEKIKLEDLKKGLYEVFSQFGNILEIQASKTLKLKGQAWIIFDDLGGASKALREMQGFNFHGKPMRVSYSRVKSDIISKMDGTFAPRPKRKLDEKKKSAPAKKKKDASKEQKTSAGPSVPMQTASAVEEPNKILFLENLPAQATGDMLTVLFKQYPGFKEARMIPNKSGIAFIEFTDDYQAAQAKEGLQGFQITPTNAMKITFAKR